MPNKLESSLDRAEKLSLDLRQEYDNCLHSKSVSEDALELTHEVFEKYRGILDRLARQIWDQCVKPHLPEEAHKKATVYFPIAVDADSFKSIMGRWRLKDSTGDNSALIKFFEDIQPYNAPNFDWMVTLNAVAVAGKHIDLVPQTRVEERRVTVSGGGGSVSWGPGVTFGSGVSVMGAPIDPATQRIAATPGVSERIETWVSFHIDGHGVNATGFTQNLNKDCRSLVEIATKEFNL